MNDELKKALLKCALGGVQTEVVEEYGIDEGEMKLTKRKESRKDIPPDLKAVQLLLGGEDYAAMDDETLEKEYQRLLALCKEENHEGSQTESGRKKKK